jgi:hypothetical protein
MSADSTPASPTSNGSMWGRFYGRHIDNWETRLAFRTTNRVVRDFEWGVEWTEGWPSAANNPAGKSEPAAYLKRLNEVSIAESDCFFGYKTPDDFRLEGGILKFTSAVGTPYPENNTVICQWCPAKDPDKRAVVVLPHWNSQAHHHVAIARGLSFFGVSALRMSLPYHDYRMPAELHRADYAVSANVGRTAEATRQAVIDTRSCLDWLGQQGYKRLGVVGTSLGSCVAFLASAHDSRLRSNVFNLFSFGFADVIWTGISTRHIREGLDGRIKLQQLRDAWKVIAPSSFLDLYARQPKKSLLIHGRHDTTFLPQYSHEMIEGLQNLGARPKVVAMPCGHYTLGQSPFKFLDGYHIISFLLRTL